jgi:hypothetical protein
MILLMKLPVMRCEPKPISALMRSSASTLKLNPDEDRIIRVLNVMDKYLNNITIPC